MSFQLNSFDGDQHASHFSQCTTKMQQKRPIQDAVRISERLSPIPNFSSRIRTQRFSPALFYQTFSCDINFIFIRKVWKLIRFSFFIFFFCCNFLHPDTTYCTMRHYKLLYYACSVSTWKTVKHTKLNRAKPIQEIERKCMIFSKCDIVIENIVLFFLFYSFLFRSLNQRHA